LEGGKDGGEEESMREMKRSESCGELGIIVVVFGEGERGRGAGYRR
jgi:hypothetical protein